MNLLKIDSRVWLSVAVIALGFIIAFSVVAQGIPEGPTEEDIDESGITFPVAELGNCASKSECRTYCNNPANMRACISFAKKHGLMNAAEADRAERFSERLEAGEGPGDCRSPDECDAYCENITHLDECLAFAEEHGIEDVGIEDARKIAVYLREGGQMPGGCVSRASCEIYCGDFSHARECYEFVVAAGIEEGDDGRGGSPGELPPASEQFQKMMELAAKGETPGGCKSRGECDAYCGDSAHIDECIEFGVKAGFMSPEEAEMFRKTGGKGPGGCDSRESCDAFCNNPSNQEACFSFAEEHGLIPEHELKGMKEGIVRLRQGLEYAPPEVHACLKSVLGPNIIEDIQSGNLTPGPAIGERVRECFEKHGASHRPADAFGDAPPEVLECVIDKIGDDAFEKIKSGEVLPTPDMGDAFRICFEKLRFDEGGFFGPPPGEGGFGGPPPDELFKFLRSAPPDVQSCLKGKLGDRLERLKEGDISALGSDLEHLIRGCFEDFRPPSQEFDEERGEFRYVIEGGGFIENVPPEVKKCIARKAGSNFLERVASGEVPRYEIEPLMRECFGELQGGFGPGGFPPPSDEERFSPPDLGGIGLPDMQNLPSGAIECIKASLGTDFMDRVKKGEVSSFNLQERIRACLQELGSLREPPHLPSPDFVPSPTPCPLMPTVDRCPEGQKRVVTFSSSECGTYYGCVEYFPPPPDNFISPPPEYKEGNYEKDYRVGEVVCIQVITPAHNPETKECRKFSTPCDVPPGWVQGCPNSDTSFESGSFEEGIKIEGEVEGNFLNVVRNLFSTFGF